MHSIQNKRPTYETNRINTTGRPYTDESLHQKLATVGARARKSVSEGHLTTGTSIPSYQGLSTGTLDQSKLRSDLHQYGTARSTQSMGPIASLSKRPREEEDEYGDTEPDEDDALSYNSQSFGVQPYAGAEKILSQPTLGHKGGLSLPTNGSSHLFPPGHGSHSIPLDDDFEEADFLNPSAR